MRLPDLKTKEKKSLARLMAEASNAMAFEARTPVGFDAPTAIIEKPAVAGAWVHLSDNFIPAKQAQPGVTFGGEGDTETRLDGFLGKNSRVAQAGAAIIIVNSLPPVGMTGGPDQLALYSRPTNFKLVKPAPFRYLADADPSIFTLTSASFIHDDGYDTVVDDAELRMMDAPSHGFRVVVTRKQQNMFAPELIAYEISKSIALGVANQIDETLLKVLATATDKQPAFSFGAAAAKNLAFPELAALVGTDGTGATVRQDGTFAVSGIDAELTSAIPGTVIGAFNRAAVAVSDEMHVLVRRQNVNGDLVVTAFVQVRALIPDSTFFWKVA